MYQHVFMKELEKYQHLFDHNILSEALDSSLISPCGYSLEVPLPVAANE